MSRRMLSAVRTSSYVTDNVNWKSISPTDKAHSAANARPMDTQLPSARMTPAAPFVPAPTKPKTTRAPSRRASRDPPVPTPQFDARIAIHPIKQATPTAQNGSSSILSIKPRMQPTREMPPWWECPIRWPSLHPWGTCSC